MMEPQLLFKDRWTTFIHALQDTICQALEAADGQAVFTTDTWLRAEENGGGGITRTIAGGHVFEKGGVNTSAVCGAMTDAMRAQLGKEGERWFACGLSLVLHPLNPMVPTVHANWRYFELYDSAGLVQDCWFGGGTDLTPYYIFPEDARHFHTTLQQAIAPFGADLYPRYKEQCDRYFINPHRDHEARGVGGVFFDHLRPSESFSLEQLFSFQQANAHAFLPAYMPIVARRKDLSYGEPQIRWQEIRRGRYVEFNLLHDRGTLFGLKTQGRTESILMSLPPRVRWEYDHQPEPGSPEAALLAALKPQDWINKQV